MRPSMGSAGDCYDNALCKPPAGAPFFFFIFLGAQKNEVAARRRHGVATRMKRKILKKLYRSFHHNK